MDRLSTLGFACGTLFIAALAGTGCGESSCPAGSIELEGRCEPAPEGCADGEVEDGGVCVELSDGGLGDAEVPGDGDGDGDDGDAGVQETADASDGDVKGLCEDLDCGEHGRCEVADGEALCACDEGFMGVQCQECTDNLVLEDGACIPACESDAAPYCRGRGVCDDSGLEPTCVCEHPYVGHTCAECAEGFALQFDNTCEPDCGVCGRLAFCNEQLMVPACDCPPGYEMDDGDCEWVGDGTTGGVVNGDFSDGSEGWNGHLVDFSNGVTFENGSGVGCELGSIEQVMQMPSSDSSEPFAVEIDVASSCSQSDSDLCPPLLLEIGDSVTRLPVQGGSASQTLVACLGANGYGDDVLLRVRPGITQGVRSPTQTAATFSCASDTWPTVKAVRIEPVRADVCPASWISNPSFTSTSHWSLSSASIASGSLSLQNQGQASTNLVVPSTAQMASSALRLGWSGSSAGTVRVSLDGLLLGTVQWPSGPSGTRELCLPDWARGTGHVLRLQSMTGAGTTVTVTEVEVTSQAACGDGSFDAGFERSMNDQAPRLGSWEGAGGYTYVDSDANHSGTKGLRITGAINAIRGLTRVPSVEVGANMGPAFQIWHKRTSASLQSTVDLYPTLGADFMINANTWTLRTDCLPRSWAGQPMVFFLAVSLTGASAELHVDDIGPALSAACD